MLAALILMCCWPHLQPDLIPGDTMPAVDENLFYCVSSVQNHYHDRISLETKKETTNVSSEQEQMREAFGALKSPVLGTIFSMPWSQLEGNCAILLFNFTV